MSCSKMYNVILLFKELCKESLDSSSQFPIIAGAKWEFTDQWDCFGNDIGAQGARNWDSSKIAIANRIDCARKCLNSGSCVSFNYPRTISICYWKHTFQKSTILGETCGKRDKAWKYYTLLDRNPLCKNNGNYMF